MILCALFAGALLVTSEEDVAVDGNSSQEFAAMRNLRVAPAIIAEEIPVDIDSMELHNSLSTFTEGASHVFESVLSKPHASYIKVHFSDFNIPSGAYVSVENADGTERYTFDNTDRTWATYDPEVSEDDGRRSFYSMSVEGNTAIVRLHVLDIVEEWNDEIHVIDVDTFVAGFALNALESKQDEVNYMSTCGKMDRYDRECWKTTRPVEYERARPVARLVKDHGGTCTAWRVGSLNRVMTNHHCINNARGVQSVEVQFNYERATCKGWATKAVTKVRGDEFLTAYEHLNFSLFTVTQFDSISQFGYYGLDPRALVRGEEIYIPQHGSGSPKQIAIESDVNSGNVCRIDDANRWGTDVSYYCDTNGGSSGSPVLAKSNNKVVALHHLGGCPNSGAKILFIWPKIARFFNYKLPDGDNENPSPLPTPAPTPAPRPTPPPVEGDFEVVSGQCPRTHNCFMSPNYPKNYGEKEKCVVKMKSRGKLTSLHFDIEESWDQLVIRGRIYSGSRGPTNLPVRIGDKIYWRSDYSEQLSGFKICLDPLGMMSSSVDVSDQDEDDGHWDDLDGLVPSKTWPSPRLR